MKPAFPSPVWSAALAVVLAASVIPIHAETPEIDLELRNGKAEVRWSMPPAETAHALTTRRWQLQRSANLETWVDEGPALTALPGASPEHAVMSCPLPGRQGFWRLQVSDSSAWMADGGEAVLGYGAGMDHWMARQRDVTPASVAALFPAAPSLTQISFDPVLANFWNEWNADPAVVNAALPPGSVDRRLFDFRLDPDGTAKFRRNGMVVSEARGAPNFTDLYYKIWTDDLPVYVSSDSILHAWHRTWITMLEELEELALRQRLITLVNQLRTHLISANVPGTLSQGKSDAVAFLNTAVLLANYAGPSPAPPGTWGSDTLALRAFAAVAPLSEVSLFGSNRLVDWTRFAPRAHYTNSDRLKSYFRTMTWLGNIDFRLDTLSDSNSYPRQLAAAVALTIGLQEAGLMDEWQEIDGILTPFTGKVDSLTPPQLWDILTAGHLGSFAAFNARNPIPYLLQRLSTGQAGIQQILTHPIPAPLEEVKLVLPRSFTFFGPRFTPENWAMGRMVFDHIWRETQTPAGPELVRVRRRLPSALEICFSVLGNNTPAALLGTRMSSTTGVPFRDGYDFSKELVSVRRVMDDHKPGAWSGSLYAHNLDVLRSLSDPMPPTVPEAFRTEAWQWKTVQTQLAGWTELRHDNLLYAKQSYTPPVLCSYPSGYVEPRPAFFAGMRRLVDFAAAAVDGLPLTGNFPNPSFPGSTWSIDLAARKAAWQAHFREFSSTLQTLEEMATREVNQQAFTSSQSAFLGNLVHAATAPYGENRTYSGWYPRLYLQSVFSGYDVHPSEIWDPLIVDVHTDGPDQVSGDPGAVLYHATGNVGLMLIAIDANGQRCIHGGPVFTYYEFTGPLNQSRLTDQEWKNRVRQQSQGQPPEWTDGFLVPGPIAIPNGVN